jgi:YXWGXW repeat-containing protein
MPECNRVGHLTALLLSVALCPCGPAGATDIELSVNVAPPPLPVYEQPAIPAAGWIWTPGYWAYGPEGYFWVPGTWVEPPEPGLVWTPGYWGWSDGVYVWNGGYWAPEVGFYGGINYGYGYPGRGYEGGYWQGSQFFYNSTVNNVRETEIHNVYTRTVVNNVTVNNISYNGGAGGVAAQPTAREKSAARQPHMAPTSAQGQQRSSAGSRHELLASVNHGRPEIAATARPGEFAGRGVTRSGSGGAPAQSGAIREARAPRAPDSTHAAPSEPRPQEERVPPQGRGFEPQQQRGLEPPPRPTELLPPARSAAERPAPPPPEQRAAPPPAAEPHGRDNSGEKPREAPKEKEKEKEKPQDHRQNPGGNSA